MTEILIDTNKCNNHEYKKFVHYSDFIEPTFDVGSLGTWKSLYIQHNLGVKFPMVEIYTDNGIPSSYPNVSVGIKAIDENHAYVIAAPFNGYWAVILKK